MAQALFSLRATLVEAYECEDLVDLPSAAMIAAVGCIAQGGSQGRRSGRNAHFDPLTATDPPLIELCGAVFRTSCLNHERQRAAAFSSLWAHRRSPEGGAWSRQGPVFRRQAPQHKAPWPL